MTARDLRRLFLTVTVSFSCGKPVASVPAPREVRFAGTAAVRLEAVTNARMRVTGMAPDKLAWEFGLGRSYVATEWNN